MGTAPEASAGHPSGRPALGTWPQAPSSAGRVPSPPPLLMGRGWAPPGRVVAPALVMTGTGHSRLQMSVDTRLALVRAAGDEVA